MVCYGGEKGMVCHGSGGLPKMRELVGRADQEATSVMCDLVIDSHSGLVCCEWLLDYGRQAGPEWSSAQRCSQGL